MDLKALLPFAIQASLFLLVLALGLRASPADAVSLLLRPSLLARSILAVDVVVPLIAVAIAWAMPLSPPVKVGIVLMAVSPFPPLVPSKQLRFSADVSYVCGLLVTISLLSIVSVPMTLTILNTVFGRDAWLPPAPLARMVAAGVLVPLGIGMTVRGLSPGLAERTAQPASILANMTLLLAVAPVLAARGPVLWTLVGDGALLAILAIAACALAAGHLLGGPDPEERTALAIASATRHPGIALMIARATGAGPQVAAAILLFLLASTVAALPYLQWQKRRVHRDGRTARSTPRQVALGRTR